MSADTTEYGFDLNAAIAEQNAEEDTKEMDVPPLEFGGLDDFEASADAGADDSRDDENSGGTKEGAADEQNSGGKEGDGEQAADAPSGLDPALVYRAGQLGVPMEKVMEFRDNHALTTTLSFLEGLRGKSESGERGTQEPEWFELPELGEAADDELANTLKGLNEGVKKSVLTLFERQKAEFEQRIESARQESNRESLDCFDETLNEMGEEWKGLFGEGYADQLDRNGKEYQNRVRVLQEVFSGRYRGSIGKRAVAAAKALFPDVVEKAARSSMVQRARDRQGKFINQPSPQRNGEAHLTPEQRAVAAVTAKMREYGNE